MLKTINRKIKNTKFKEYIQEYCYDYHVFYEDEENNFIVVTDLYDGEIQPFMIFEKEGKLVNALGYELGIEDNN